MSGPCPDCLCGGVPSVPKHRRLLGLAIRSARHRAALTQERLAEKADLSAVFISLLENGRMTVSLDSLFRIAKSMGVTLGDLVAKIR